ncbi:MULTISPECIES: aldo/keto reductase [Rossellomorea]|uniref:aldo/keto reductase n=1 Tax=Rossellomorea TaxID=2837508 RepID=UPI001CD033C2|nr:MULTISPECIES: aldo/keto reductase [Rossellomorea]MCA0147732.1 aldo/keto reductase [Rossellomorea vietnamensis]UTE76225.1 aldo/keto reductase [Rossellomorea sp. KS-H15a]WGG44066.1 aldo/keto reductase [Rossellomorea sp. DA94]
MEKRQIGHSDLHVSKMGLGCMSLGTEESSAKEIVQHALENGINYLDTADLYDFGQNEEIVGNAIRDVRDDIILATKGGNRWNDVEDGWRWDPSKSYIKSAVKDSLSRLKVDYIDLYQLHGGTIEDDFEETIEAFEELKKEGLIRYYGISSIRPNVIKRFLSSSSIDSVMMQYSLLDRRPEEWMDLLDENKVSIVARGPLAKGLLSEKMLSKASAKMKEDGYLDYSYQELEETLKSIHEKMGDNRSMNELALQYILAHESVGAVIPGASSVQQLQENIDAVNAEPLSSEELDMLKQLTKLSRYEQHRD